MLFEDEEKEVVEELEEDSEPEDLEAEKEVEAGIVAGTTDVDGRKNRLIIDICLK